MDHILKAASFGHRCNACGGIYRVSLPPEACHGDFNSIAAAIPADLLEHVDEAWDALSERIPPSLHLTVAHKPDG
jgi:hypothetical protein